MKKKIIAILCAIAMLIPMAVLPTSAAYTWVRYSAPSDIDYSFAVIGDMQTWTYNDTNKQARDEIAKVYPSWANSANWEKTKTTYLSSMFDWLLENKSGRKIEYVFGLGDTIETLSSYPSTANSKYDAEQDKYDYCSDIRNPIEWTYAASQISRLDGVIPYMIIRGNHDDGIGYHNNICTTDYKNQMSGFLYDSNSAPVAGNTMSNCFRKIEIGGVKYLMLGLDYEFNNEGKENKAVVNWANEVISSNPDHRVIVSVHAYVDSNGAYYDTTDDTTEKPENITQPGTPVKDYQANSSTIEFDGQYLWDNIFSKHENVFMVLSGHVATTNSPVIRTSTGNMGNTVYEILVDPSINSTTQNSSNFVMMLNFREDANELEIEYLSPSRAMAGEWRFHVSGKQYSKTYNDIYIDTTDWESVVKGLNIPVYVGAAMDNGPTLDGTVNEREYSYKKYYAPDVIPEYSESETQSGITEYIAHDADYVYYAVSFTQEADDRALQWQFNPLNSFGIFKDKTNLKNTLFQRVSWQLRYQSNGTVTVGAPHWNYSMSGTLPVVGTDLQYEVTKTEDNVKTYEIKLSKDYLAKYNNCSKEDIKVIPYMTIVHESTYIAHKYTQEEVNTLIAAGATRAELGAAPIFMVFEEAPDAIQNTIKPTTKNGASVRVSVENSGLRFKTKINRSDLDALVEKYGEENVSVGTLIAPIDILQKKGLTVADNKCDAFTYENTNLTFKVDFVAVVVPQTKEGEYVGFRTNEFINPDHPEEDADEVYTFAGSLSNIKTKNIGREFVGRGYISYIDFNGETHYIYSDTVCVRSVDHVATAALNDANANYSMKARAILEQLTVKYWEEILKDPFKDDPFFTPEN